MIDGDVITATNAAIRNTAERGTIRVARVEVRPGAYAIGNYEDFQERLEAIALSLNGCPTRAAGELTISGRRSRTSRPGRSWPSTTGRW